MSEEDAPSARSAWNVRIIFGSAALAFCLAVISFIVVKGTPGNSLHDSALSWSFMLVIAILAGFGVGTVAEPILALFKKK